MFAYEKKMPVKSNTTKKKSKRSDEWLKEHKEDRYYFDDIRVNTKSPSLDVVQRVLFADIPLGDQGEFEYKKIEEMQVWWFMACEAKKQSKLGGFTPEKHLKSLRTVLPAGGLGAFGVEPQDVVRLASHGSYEGKIYITDSLGESQECSPDEVIGKIKQNIEGSDEKQVDADYCFIMKSGLPITREKQMYQPDDSELGYFNGPTISGVGKTYIFNEDDFCAIGNEMTDFVTSMTEGMLFKSVDKAKENFPKLSAYIAGEDVQLEAVLTEVYDTGKIAMDQLMGKISDICATKNISPVSINGIWGDSVD